VTGRFLASRSESHRFHASTMRGGKMATQIHRKSEAARALRARQILPERRPARRVALDLCKNACHFGEELTLLSDEQTPPGHQPTDLSRTPGHDAISMHG